MRSSQNIPALIRALNENSGIFTVVTGPVDGKPHWAYAEIEPKRYLAFLDAQARPEGYRLADYARKIHAHGEGEQPPQDVIERIQAELPHLRFDLEPEMARMMRDALTETAEAKGVTIPETYWQQVIASQREEKASQFGMAL